MWNARRFSRCHEIPSHPRRNARLLLLSLLPIACLLPTVAQAAPTITTLVVSSSSVASPAAVTLTASVTASGTPVTTGSIIFCDATTTLSTAPSTPASAFCKPASVVGTAQLTQAGSTLIKLVPAIGTHSYTAVFAATDTAATSTSTAHALTVTGLYPSTTAIAAAGNPDGYLLTATVVGFTSEPPALAGTVSFEDTTNNNSLLGTAVLGTPIPAHSFKAAPGSPVQTGANPTVAGVGDFNEDGIPDLAVVNTGDNTISILLGKGDGSFTAGAKLAAIGTPPCESPTVQSNCAIAVGDFNHDGHADLAATSGNDNTVTILKGAGDGTFTPFNGSPITVGHFPEAVKVGDFNNDGIQDLAVANAADNTISILLGDGDGTFTAATPITSGLGPFPFFLAIADFDGDGNADMAIVNGREPYSVSILKGDGAGAFTAFSGSPIPFPNTAGPTPIVAADFNSDGKIDLAVANYQDNNVDILLGNGDGTFAFSAGSPVAVGAGNPAANPFAMVALDYDGDNKTDLAVANYNGDSVTILVGDGTGNFAPAGADVAVGILPNDVVTADFNGDGKPDLAVPESGDTTTTILLNSYTQTATASLGNVVITGTGTHYADASYPGDTYFAPSISGTVPLMGSAVPTTLTLNANPTQQLYSLPVTFTTQLTATGAYPPVGTPTGTVSFFDAGALIGTAPINSAGVAVYTTTSLADGAHTITASYGGDPNYLASSTAAAVSVTISDLQIVRTGNNDTTVIPGTAVPYTLKVSPLVATTFLYNVTFSASGLPAGATATFSPATLAAGTGTATVALTIQTANTAALNTPPSPFPYQRLPLALGLLVPLLGVARIRKRMGPWAMALLLALSLPVVAGLSGCSKPGLFAARKVSYSITVTASSGNASGTLQRSTSVPLAIQ